MFGIFLLRGRRPGFTIFGSKIYAKIMKIHEKWSQEATKKAWEIIKNEVLKTSWFWGAFLEARGLRFSWLLASLGRFWDDFGDPLKSEGAPKTTQKNQYGDLEASGTSPGAAKNSFLGPLENASFSGWIFHAFRFLFGSFFWCFLLFFPLPFRDCFMNVFF